MSASCCSRSSPRGRPALPPPPHPRPLCWAAPNPITRTGGDDLSIAALQPSPIRSRNFYESGAIWIVGCTTGSNFSYQFLTAEKSGQAVVLQNDLGGKGSVLCSFLNWEGASSHETVWLQRLFASVLAHRSYGSAYSDSCSANSHVTGLIWCEYVAIQSH